jgi:aminocarboxymuconate-semialdehyde decarboxylase
MKVDLHTHILPRTWPDLDRRYGYSGFVQLEHHGPGCARMIRNGQCFREIRDNCWDPQRRLEDCDAAGVTLQVLSTVPVMFSYWARPEHAHDLARLLNDHIAEVVADFPERFAGLGTLPMQDPDRAIEELERCSGELGLAGVQIGTNVNGQNLDEPHLFPILKRCAELGTAVFVHPWDMLGGERTARYWMPWLVAMPAETAVAICSLIMGGVLERLPDLRIGFAHGGGTFGAVLGRLEHGFRARPDLCATAVSKPPSAYLQRIYVDSLVHDPHALRLLLHHLGSERIALGSDYPFPLGEDRPGALIDSLTELDERVRQRLFAGTALEFLGMSAED